jgi:hypothetical protein
MTGITDLTTYLAGVVVPVLLSGPNSNPGASVGFPGFRVRPAPAALH